MAKDGRDDELYEDAAGHLISGGHPPQRADDERRAEIEVVARALYENGDPERPPFDDSPIRDSYRRMAEAAIAELDRVRDAQGDDEVLPEPQSVKDYKAMVRGAGLRALIPYVHRQTGFGIHNCDFEECQIEGCPTLRALLARSPQGEDHEAGMEAAARELQARNRPGALAAHVAREVVNAYLSRVSPSRDGTVAVEDVAEWLDRQANAVRFHGSGDRNAAALQSRLRGLAESFAAEFSPASTGDRETSGS